MKNNIIQPRERASNLLFWALVFVLFLPIILLPPNFQPSDWSRTMLFRIIITALASFLLFRFFYKKNISIELPKWNISTYLPLLVLAGFFITLIISTLFSQDIVFSLFGSPSRAGGVLNLLFYFLFSTLLALFINKNQWEKLFKILFITGILASSLAIVQYFNLLKSIFIAFEGGSTPSFMGNSTILAIYMLFLAFLSFVFFIQKQKKKEKVFYGALFLLFVFTILITGSRAGYLGLLAGFLYFFLFYPYAKRFKLLKIAAISILLLTIFTIALFNFFPQLGEKNNILKIITNRVSIQKITMDILGVRLPVWKMTLQAIQDKPVLGFGPENFYIGFEKYYDPIPFSHAVLLWDRPHNILLDVAASSGILSLLLYIAFWIAIFWKLKHTKNSQKKDDYYADNTIKIHGVQAMFIAYLIVLFFNFDSFASYLISFFFIGYSFYLISFSKEKIVLLPPKNAFFKKKSLVFACLAIVIMFLWFWNIKPLYLNEKITHAKSLSSEGGCKKALNISNNENWEKAGILKSYAILLYSDIVKNCASAKPEEEAAYIKKMVSLLKVATDAQPKFSRTWFFRGSFVNVLAARESASDKASASDKSSAGQAGETKQGAGLHPAKENLDNQKALLQEARDYFKKALELSPKRQETFAELGKNYLIAQDYEAMKKVGQDCIAIDPQFGECYWYLGLAQIFLGDQENGKKNTDLAIKNGYNYNPMYKQLAVAYMSQKNWGDAVLAYEKLRVPDETLNPAAAASYYATLAFLYDKAGDYEKAGRTALEVFRLQPENPETLPFIKLLLGKRPNSQILNSSLAFIYSQPGPTQELYKAKAIYLQLVHDSPKNKEYVHQLTRIQYQLKEYLQAYQGALGLIELNPILKVEMEAFIKTLPPAYWAIYARDHLTKE